MPKSLVAFLLAAACWCLAVPLTAQCTPVWQTGEALPNPLGNAQAMSVFDPDGAGPAVAELMVGGSFAVGMSTSNLVAGYDGTQWSPAGTGGPTGSVRAFVQFQGQLIAAANSLGGTLVWAWNGTTWQVLGACTGFVRAMAVHAGELVVAGSITAVGAVPVAGLARWNGTTWSAFGTGVQGTVNALAVFNNVLHVGGSISQAGGIGVSNYAIWNGTSWLAGPSFNAPIETFTTRIGTATTNSWLFAGGSFTTIAGLIAANHVARYSPATNSWSALPGLPGNSCSTLFVRSTGISTFEVTAGVDDPTSAQKAWRWNGTSWTGLGSFADLPAVPSCFSYYNGQYAIGLRTPTQRAICVFHYDGTTWTPLAGPGIDGDVHAVNHGTGEVVIGGEFRNVHGIACNRVARLAGGVWSALGTGVDGPVYALTRLANGDVLVGGSFTTAGGVPANNIARWLANGNGWSNLGTGTSGAVRAILVLQNGDVIVGGDFPYAGGVIVGNVARWTGVWSNLGQGNNNGFVGSVRALAELPDGTFVAGGTFPTTTGPFPMPMNHVSHWTGGVWEQMATGLDGTVHALATMQNGSLVAGGEFLTAGGVTRRRLARWDGTAWQAVTLGLNDLNATVRCLAPLPDGSLLAGGDLFSFSLSPLPGGWSANLVRVTGSSVAPLPIADLRVDAVAVARDGDLGVGGSFLTADGLVSGNFAQRETPCPATANEVGTGCQSQYGLLRLSAQNQPWLGTTFRAEGLPFPPGSLAFDLVGFAPQATPLSALHPAGGPGCMLLVSPLSSQLLVPNTGRVATQIAIPTAPGLIGMALFEQLLEVEFNAAGLTRLAASNALQLLIGSN
jgi:trimeric autotransporter adhesin